MINVRTTAAEGTLAIEGTEINQGRFRDSETVTLESGRSKEVTFAWKPFDPNAYRGNANAEIKILNGNGTVPTGRTITVSWFDGHFGSLNVFEGPLPETGIISLNGVSGARHRSAAPFGPYTVSIDNERLAFFRLNDTKKLQQFQFSVSPKARDIAPDFEFLTLESQEHGRLSDFRGKVVLLEFWSTGCGPCQPAMQKLSELAEKMPAAWKDNVRFVAVNTDQKIDNVRAHIAGHGWTGLTHVLGVRQPDEHFSDVEKAYVIHGIPHAILVDQHGKVQWRGHPSATDGGKSIKDRIDELLK